MNIVYAVVKNGTVIDLTSHDISAITLPSGYSVVRVPDGQTVTVGAVVSATGTGFAFGPLAVPVVVAPTHTTLAALLSTFTSAQQNMFWALLPGLSGALKFTVLNATGGFALAGADTVAFLETLVTVGIIGSNDATAAISGTSASASGGSSSGGSSAPAQSLAQQKLGSAYGYSVFGGTVTTSGAAAANWIVGGSSAAISGPSIGARQNFGNAAATQAQQDILTAYNSLMAMPTTGAALSGDLAGLTFHAGVYSAAAAITNSAGITLDAQGDSTAVFVFKLGAAFAPAASSTVTLVNGALASNVFWIVAGATTLGASAKLAGTILSPSAIGFGAGCTLAGRALSNTDAITLAASTVTTS